MSPTEKASSARGAMPAKYVALPPPEVSADVSALLAQYGCGPIRRS
jgi:hypothetical protein